MIDDCCGALREGLEPCVGCGAIEDREPEPPEPQMEDLADAAFEQATDR